MDYQITFQLIKYGFLLLICIVFLPSSGLLSQTSIYVSADGAFSGLAGETISIGANEALAHGSFGLGVTFSNFDRRQVRGVEYDSYNKNQEYGLRGYFTRFFQKERNSGLYWGLRSGVHFSKTKSYSLGGVSSSRSSFNMTATGQFGYQVRVSESAALKLQISSGLINRRWANLFGFQFSFNVNEPKDS